MEKEIKIVLKYCHWLKTVVTEILESTVQRNNYDNPRDVLFFMFFTDLQVALMHQDTEMRQQRQDRRSLQASKHGCQQC